LRKILLTGLVSLLLVCISCEKHVGPVPTPGVIVPLKIGNLWAYKIRIFDESGAVTDSSYDTVSVTAQTLIDNELWYIDNEGNVQTNRADGLWVHSGVPYLVEKFPAKLNEFYRLIDTATIVRVSGVDEGIVVPTGRYLSYIYSWTRNGFMVGDFFYAPNVGMIKSDKYAQHGASVYLIERKELVWVSLQL